MQENKKILIIKLAAIGDVVHTTIIPKAIKEKHPLWKIHYLIPKGIAPIIENQKYIDKIYEWETLNKDSFRYLFEIIKNLKKEKYDIIFNLSFSIRNFIIAFLTFPKKIVYKKYNKNTWVEDYFNSAKSVIDDLELPKNLQLDIDEKIDKNISDFLNKYQKPYILISPGPYNSPRQGRIWNIEKWMELSSRLLKIYGGTVFVNGSEDEYDYHKQLSNENIIVISGKFNLKESAAITSKMNIVISGDSGPLHIASALNVNTLAILGSTSPDKIKPYGEKGYFIEPSNNCRYCWEKKCKFLQKGEAYTPCTESISVNQVIEKIQNNNLIK